MRSRLEPRFAVLTPSGTIDAGLAIGACRAGALGVLNAEFTTDAVAVLDAMKRLANLGGGPYGVLLDTAADSLRAAILTENTPGLEVVILAGDVAEIGPIVAEIRSTGRRAYFVATRLDDAIAAEAAGVDAIIAKGHESAGWVGEETAFILLQRFRDRIGVPLWVQGGIGPHTIAAAGAAGVEGVVLDSQVLLARESPLPQAVRVRIASMDGSETICSGTSLNAGFRCLARPDLPASRELSELLLVAESTDEPGSVVRRAWRETIRSRVGWDDPKSSLLAVGQDGAFAATLAKRFNTVGGILAALRSALISGAVNDPGSSLREGAPLAVSHGTRYPIVQGPMTRVSDSAEFALAVAEAGALPFLALALMRGSEVDTLLTEAKRKLGDKPWGVGILGFVPKDLRAEQLEVIRAHRPPFALIAGGRPDQARILEADGIATYLHVPSPGLLEMFLKDGARRFVFEGRECGGHVGPRTSFVLWESMIEGLLNHLGTVADASDYHVLFAGGIHDGFSAGLVAAAARPLTRRGARVGVLVGTAYLFTREAVSTGAIQASFQQAALDCDETVLLESGPGHATRCLPSPFVADFHDERRRLTREGVAAEVLKHSLEELNIGRLRVASKGVDRNPEHGENPNAPRLRPVEPNEQWSRGMYMIGQAAVLRGEPCSLAELHAEIASCRTGIEPLAATTKPSDAPEPCAIAIVGMGSIVPGAADSRSFWANILNKVDCVTEVPRDRWDASRYYDQNRSARDRIYSRWGGFIGDIPFDAARYGMPPSSLRSIEPFQLLALEVVRAALADAGYHDRPFPRERTSVILGAGGGGGDLTAGYMVRSSLPSLFGEDADTIAERLGGRLPCWTEDSFPGLLMNVAAGRVANRFDFGGVNCTVDAACASSLAAVYLAVRELQAKTSDVAVVGGIDAIQNPFAFLCFSKTQALSPDGRCKTFDAEADGIAISEGFAAVILKRLDDAERDGDRIYAVIRGVGGSSDGRDRSMTAPRPEGQARALRRAYAQAGFSPGTVGLLEAHGTGTAAGDLAEIRSLTDFFDREGAERQCCAVGSVKSMIGHAKATAGVAGLIKASLALHHRVLPATINVKRPNPKANFHASPFYVNTETRPWVQPSSGHPRRAGVSAFGFGGTNFHIVLEEYDRDYLPKTDAAVDPWPAELLLWRADSREELIDRVGMLATALAKGGRPRLADLSRTTCDEATDGRLALAIVAETLDDLAAKLVIARDHLLGESERVHDPRGIHFTARPLLENGKIAFLFPGQGSQYVNMGRDLALGFPEFRECFDRADRVMKGRLDHPLSRYVYPPPVFSPEDEKLREAALTETHVAQPALGAANLGYLAVLRGVGIEPDMTAGHSFGEFVALHSGGCFDESTLIDLAAVRGAYIREETRGEPGCMAAVDASPKELETLIAESGLTLANHNAPRQSVISGARDAIETAVAACRAQGKNARVLPVARAFHSPLVAPARRKLAEHLGRLKFSTPSRPVYSNVTATPYPLEPDAIADLLSRHLVQPVEFVREVESMHDAGARLFIEVGPRGVLTGLAGRILDGRDHLAIALDAPGRSGLVSLLHALAAMATEGVALRTSRLFEGRSTRRLNLGALDRVGVPASHSPTTWLVNGGSARPANSAAVLLEPLRVFVEAEPLQSPSSCPANPQPRATSVSHTPNHSNGHATKEAATNSQISIAPQPGASSTPADSGSADDLGAVAEPSPQHQPRSRWPRRETNGGPMAPAPITNGSGTVHAGPLNRLAGQLGEPLPSTAAPPPPIQNSATTTVEIVCQFQQVMMQFLHTQENVMHNLLATFGAGTPLPSTRPSRKHRGDGLVAPRPVMYAPEATRPLARDPEPQPPPNSEPVAPIHSAQTNGTSAEVVTAPPRVEPSATPVSPQAVASDKAALVTSLLAIVSERTGYPESMLGLDLDLEADLGVDSIKRVEIAGTLIRSLHLADDRSIDLEQLTSTRTLRQVVDTLDGLLQGRGTQENGLPFDDARTGDGIGRFALKVIDAPTLPEPSSSSDPGLVLIVDDEVGVGLIIESTLKSRGFEVIRIGRGVPSSGSDAVATSAVGTDLNDPDVVAHLAASLRAKGRTFSALIYLAALRTGGGEESDFNARQARIERLLIPLFLLVKELRVDLHSSKDSDGAVVLGATGLGGGFGVEGAATPDFPEYGAILGFLKSLAAEWPRVRVKAVDVAVEDRSAAAEAILAELAARDGLVEVGRLGKRRVKLAVTPAPIKSDSSVSRLGPNSIILVTGGARGITATATLELARHANQATFVIVGRSVVPSEPEPAEIAQYHEPTELKRALIKLRQSEGRSVTPSEIEGECRRILQSREARANLERLRATGASVDYRACDTCDGDAFAKLIEDVTRQYGRIDGVIHGAGVIEDRLIQDKSIESLRRVLRTKTTGALVLAATLRAESLKFLALFSSVSGRFGNRGQADYAAGSEALNKLSQALDRRWPSRVVAIEWGPWLQTGMVSEGVRRQFVERGVTLIPSETGCRMFVEEVLQGRKGAAEIVVGGASGLGTLPAPPMAAAAAVEKPSVALRPIKRPPLLAVAGDFPREGDVFAVLRPLDPEIDLYLNDHRIDNRPVFPFAMAMELMAEVAVASRPGWVVSEVRRVRLLRGVVVNERAPMLRIVARPVEHQGDAVLSSLAVTIASVDQPERLHYSAEVVLVPEGSPPEATPPFEARSGRIVEPSPITVDEAYREWLFHGPAFQGITRIDAMDARGIRGALRTSKPSNCLRGAPEGSWLLDPILIDSAFQMQVLWARKHWDVTLLPAGVGSFRPRADSSGSMNQAPRELEYEMIIRPESGRPCCVCDHRLGEATLRGVEGTGSRALNRLAGSAGR